MSRRTHGWGRGGACWLPRGTWHHHTALRARSPYYAAQTDRTYDGPVHQARPLPTVPARLDLGCADTRPGRSCSLLFSRCACPGPPQHPPAHGAALPQPPRAAARLRGALAWGGLAFKAHGCGCLLLGTRQAALKMMTRGVAFSRRRRVPRRALPRTRNTALAARACADRRCSDGATRRSNASTTKSRQ